MSRHAHQAPTGHPIVAFTRGLTRGVAAAVAFCTLVPLSPSLYVATVEVPSTQGSTPPPGLERPVLPSDLPTATVASWRPLVLGAPMTMPDHAWAAYVRAATVIDAAAPVCHADWQLVAGVGQVASDHGRISPRGTHRLDPDGVAVPRLLGQLVPGLRDTDSGVWDHSRRADRPVGPMQLLPSTWRSARVDADGDGRRDPQDVDDAALAVAVVLCSPPHDLRRRTARVAALRLLNARPSFVTAVLRARHTFMGPPSGPVGPVALVRLGATDAAAPSSAIREPGPVATAQGDAKPEAEAAAAAAAAAPLIGTATPEGCSDPPPTTPAPAPSPAPEPTPAPLPAGFVEATPTASLTATSSPTPNPTPSGDPAANPDAVVSGVPTDLPTTLPTTLPTDAATAPPTAPPTALPTALSSASPEAAPTPDPPLLRLSARARAVGCR